MIAPTGGHTKNEGLTPLPFHEIEELRLHTRTGQPLGGESFVNLAEALTGRFLRKRKPGPKHRR